MKARSLLLLPVMLGGCTPVYVPSAMHAPLHHRSGELHVAARGGTQGGQADVSYAVTDSVALRASGQGFRSRQASAPDEHASFVSGGGGVSLFHGGAPASGDAFPAGLRSSGSLELHGGRSSGYGELGTSLPPRLVNYSGTFLRPALQADVGYASKHFRVGAAGRFSYFHYSFDQASDTPGQSAWSLVGEPSLFARFGFERVKFELQAGLRIPLAARDDAALPVPLSLSGGIIVDL